MYRTAEEAEGGRARGGTERGGGVGRRRKGERAVERKRGYVLRVQSGIPKGQSRKTIAVTTKSDRSSSLSRKDPGKRKDDPQGEEK